VSSPFSIRDTLHQSDPPDPFMERNRGEWPQAVVELELSFLSARSNLGAGPLCSGHLQRRNWRRSWADQASWLLPPAGCGPTSRSSRGPARMFSPLAEHDRVLGPASEQPGSAGIRWPESPVCQTSLAIKPRGCGLGITEISRPSPGGPGPVPGPAHPRFRGARSRHRQSSGRCRGSGCPALPRRLLPARRQASTGLVSGARRPHHELDAIASKESLHVAGQGPPRSICCTIPPHSWLAHLGAEHGRPTHAARFANARWPPAGPPRRGFFRGG